MKKLRIGKTLFFYIFTEMMLYCFVSFLFFFVIFFVNNLLVEIQGNLIKNVSIALIMKFFLYSLPIVVANAAPYSAFVGALMCLGRFASDYEFIALNSLGLSHTRILLPTMAVALTFSLLNFFTNDILIPFTAPKLNDTYLEMMSENPAMQLQSHSIRQANQTIIAAGEVTKEGVSDIVIIDSSEPHKTTFLSAKTAKLAKTNNPEILLSLQPIKPRLFILDTHTKYDFDYAYAENMTYNFLASEQQNFGLFSLGPGQLSFSDLRKRIKEIQSESITNTSYLNWYNLELHKKFSIPFGALFFIFLAYTISINLKLYNQGLGFVVGLFISVAYWAILMMGQQLSVENKLDSTIGAWIANAVLLVVALILVWKKKRA
ncbi:MAG: LptF/LptG family permease [Spirochaetaceae bacterium]|nr:LptF/LptG family permease [Spirochaetaceae bacterium]